jgi:putative endonuclease
MRAKAQRALANEIAFFLKIFQTKALALRRGLLVTRPPHWAAAAVNVNFVLIWTPAFAGVTKTKVQMERLPCVYILASRRNGTLYTGVTSDLIKRVWQHKNDAVEGFTKRYRVHILVWYETHETIMSAIEREKAVKEWKRNWKIKLIEDFNPEWKDLYSDLL